MRPNFDVKESMLRHGIFQWQLADKLGVCEMTLIRWLRKELPKEKHEQIMSAIAEMKEEQSHAATNAHD